MMLSLHVLLIPWQQQQGLKCSFCFLLFLLVALQLFVALDAVTTTTKQSTKTNYFAFRTDCERRIPQNNNGGVSPSLFLLKNQKHRRDCHDNNNDDDDDDTTSTTRQQDLNLLLMSALRGGGGHENILSSSLSSPSSTLALDKQGGSSSLSSNMFQTAIQSLLDLVQGLSPSVASILRNLLHNVENIFGIQLLPSPPPVKKKNKSKKTKSKNESDDDDVTAVKTGKKKKAKKKTVAANDDDDDDSDVLVTSTTSSKKKKKKTSSDNAAITKRKKNKSSASITAHLNKPLSTSSPNYRIQRELQAFLQDPPPNLNVKVGSKNIRVWIVTMTGAKNTIYDGEVFHLRIAFPTQYPTVPPSVYFLPPHIPLHEHVYTNGDICLSLLGNDWRPTMTAQSIAVSILSILSSAQSKSLPMDNARHAQNKPGQYQQDWVYHDDNC